MFKRPLHHSTPQAAIKRQLDEDQLLTQRVRKLLPIELQPHCLYCAQKRSSLMIYTDSSVWASRLFYQREKIIAGLKGSTCEPLRTLKTRVRPQQKLCKPKIPHQHRPVLSKLIRQSCGNPQDDKLNQSLLKLAKALDEPGSKP